MTQSKLTFDALVHRLQEQVFFAFMDHGRQGIVDTSFHVRNDLYQFMREAIAPKDGSPPTPDLSFSELEGIKKVLQHEMLNGFVLHGSSGIGDGIRTSYQVMYNRVLLGTGNDVAHIGL